jgi:hypothetical protein
VLRTHRKLGIATKLMRATHHQMKTIFKCDCVSLHVRVSNIAALTLYRDVLGYEVRAVDPAYYADKEDAYDMRLAFKKSEQEEEKTTEETDDSSQKVNGTDTYAESNLLKSTKTTTAEETESAKGPKVSKNKAKRDKKKAKTKDQKDQNVEEVQNTNK